MAARPPIYPFIDLTGSNIDTNYANNPLTQTGFSTGVVIPSREHNTLWLLGSLWLAYLDYNTNRLSDAIDGATPQQWSTDKLAYTVGASVLVVGANVSTFGTYMFEGYRIQTSDAILVPAGASPLLLPFATTPGRIWVYADVSLIGNGSPPFVPVATIRVESVGPADPETPGANELALVGVDIDASGFVTGNTYPASEPVDALIYNTRRQIWEGLADFLDSVSITTTTNTGLTVTSVNVAGNNAAIISADAGAAMLLQNVSATDATVTIENPIGTALVTTGDVALGGDLVVDDDITAYTVLAYNGLFSGTIVRAYGDIISYSNLYVSYDGSFGGDVLIGGGLLSALGIATGGYLTVDEDVTLCGGAGNFTCTIGTSNLDTLTSAATATFSSAVNLCTGVGNFTLTIGTSSADTMTVLASPTFSSPVAVATTTATTSLQVTNGSTGPALGAVAGAHYAATFTNDATAPARAVVNFFPQDADPTTPAQGDWLHNLSRALGVFRYRNSSAWQSVHGSSKGYLYAAEMAADQIALIGASAELCRCTITPEEVGDVVLEATFFWEPGADTTTIDIVIRDDTAASNLVQRQIRAKDVDGAGARGETVCCRIVYTLPSVTANREFVIVVQTSASADVYNPMLTVQGVV
jgi:hypothetical protein